MQRDDVPHVGTSREEDGHSTLCTRRGGDSQYEQFATSRELRALESGPSADAVGPCSRSGAIMIEN